MCFLHGLGLQFTALVYSSSNTHLLKCGGYLPVGKVGVDHITDSTLRFKRLCFLLVDLKIDLHLEQFGFYT